MKDTPKEVVTYDAASNTFMVEVSNTEGSRFIIHGDPTDNIGSVNDALNTRSHVTHIKFIDGGLHPALNMMGKDVRVVEIHQQHLTAQHVAVIERFFEKGRGLLSFSAVNCTFDVSAERDARHAFFRAVLTPLSKSIPVDNTGLFHAELSRLQCLFSQAGLSKTVLFKHVIEKILATALVPEEVLSYITDLACVKKLENQEALISQFLSTAQNMRTAVHIASHSNNPKDFLMIARRYIEQYQPLVDQADKLEKSLIRYLRRIPVQNVQHYSAAEDKITTLIWFRVKRILCGERQNKLSAFQNSLVENLSKNTTVGAMITTLRNFLENRSHWLCFWSSNTVDGKVIDELKKLLSKMVSMERVDLTQKVSSAERTSTMAELAVRQRKANAIPVVRPQPIAAVPVVQVALLEQLAENYRPVKKGL